MTSGCTSSNIFTRHQLASTNCFGVLGMSTPMTSYKDQLAKEFSTFLLADLSQGTMFPLRRTDRGLRRLMGHIVSDDPLTISHDHWAQYLLLKLQTIDGEFVPPSSPDSSLVELRLQAYANQPDVLLQLHHYLQARQTEASLHSFFRQGSRDPQHLLIAYLQPSYWYATRRFVYKHYDHRSTQWDDYLQMAMIAISDPAKLLKHYDFRKSQVRTYAETKIYGVVYDTVRANHVHEKVNNLGRHGLLRAVSRRQIRECLLGSGRSPEDIDQYSALWQSYREIHQAPPQQGRNGQARRIPDPTAEEWQAIVDRYHAQSPTLLPIANWQDAEQMLGDLETVIRNHCDPKTLRQRLETEADQQQKITPLDEILDAQDAQRLEQQLQCLQESLAATLQHLDPGYYHAMLLWLGLGFTQSDVLKLMGASLGTQKQYQLSRKLDAYKRKLIQPLARQICDRASDLTDTPLSAEQIIRNISEHISEVLKLFCRQAVSDVLSNLVLTLAESDYVLLQSAYNQELRDDNSDEFSPSLSPQASQDCLLAEQHLLDAFKLWMQDSLDIDLAPYPELDKKLIDFIRQWLTQHIM